MDLSSRAAPVAPLSYWSGALSHARRACGAVKAVFMLHVKPVATNQFLLGDQPLDSHRDLVLPA